MKKILGVVLLMAISWRSNAQGSNPCYNTFVKHLDGIGKIEPRLFKDSTATNFFLTARNNDTTFISCINTAGNVIWTRTLTFPGDAGTIKDMVVDKIDGTLVGIVKGNNNNFIFRYNYVTSTFNWVKSYPANYLFENIHQIGLNGYIVTGEVLNSSMTIFRVDRNTGMMNTVQGTGFTGEFLSTYDGKNVYGACQYYSSGSLFNSSLFQFSATGNVWTSTYIQNTVGSTARIYPVAPIVDKNNLVQLSSGDGTGLGTYPTSLTSVWLLKTDLNGSLIWTKQISIPGYTRLNAKKIINTAGGYYLLIDAANGALTNYFFVVKTDKNGRIQWTNRYGISGQNTVVSAVENNGYLHLTALSQSYNPNKPLLYLKLNPLGMTDIQCPYVQPVSANDSTLVNTQAAKPTPFMPTSNVNTPATTIESKVAGTEKIHCATPCILPCGTLTGSLATGVMAFYPFGNGSLSDLSGNGYDLINPTTAYATLDRGGSAKCAYHFDMVNGDFLTVPAGGSGFLNNITTSPFSISLWYQATGLRPGGNYELLVGRGNTPLHCPDTWGEWSVGLHDCRKAVVGFDRGSYWETNSITDCDSLIALISNTWHHLVFVYDGVNSKLYKDGILYTYTAFSGTCGNMSANIGELMLGVDYTGDLDDIIIYNRALSAAEVTALRNLNGSCCDGLTSTVSKPFSLPALSNAVKVYPNPTSGKVSVSADGAMIRRVCVYNNTGRLLHTYECDATTVSVDMNRYTPGIYFLKVTTATGSTTEKVIRR